MTGMYNPLCPHCRHKNILATDEPCCSCIDAKVKEGIDFKYFKNEIFTVSDKTAELKPCPYKV